MADVMYGVTLQPATSETWRSRARMCWRHPGQGPSGRIRAMDVRTGTWSGSFLHGAGTRELGHDTWEGESWTVRTGEFGGY